MTVSAARKLNGRQKAAALMIALGSELSALVLKHLKETDIDRVTVEIFSMERIAHEVRIEVLDEALQLATAQGYISSGGVEYAKEVLTQALGGQRATEIVDRLASGWRSEPFDFVRMADPAQLVGFIQDERPQTIALVMSHLHPSLAASILARLDRELQADVALRIATMERTTPEAIEQVENTLKKRLSSVLNQDFSSVGGVEFLVKILTQVNRGTEKIIMQSLEESDPALAEEVRKQMFVFEDVVKLDDRSIQRVLREVDSKDLALALRGASEEVKGRVFKNMSQRAGQMLKEDMEVSGPVRVRTVEDAQQRIVAVVRRLDDAEEIVIARGGEEDEIISKIIKMADYKRDPVVVGVKPSSGFAPKLFGEMLDRGTGDETEDAAASRVGLETAKEQAERIVAEAETRAVEITREAAAQGFMEGKAEGLKAAEGECRAYLDRIAEMAKHATIDRQGMIRSASGELASLAIAIGAKVIRREIGCAPSVVLSMVEAAMERVSAGGAVRVVVHPDDVELLRDKWCELRAAAALGTDWEVVGDGSMERGGCVIHTKTGTVDSRIETQLSEIIDAFEVEP